MTHLGKICDFFALCDLAMWQMTLKDNRASLLCYFKLCASFHSHRWIQTQVTVRKQPIWVKICIFFVVWPWNIHIYIYLSSTLPAIDPDTAYVVCISISLGFLQQGKSEGFESCDRPIIRKRPIWVKIGDVLSRVTLKFDGWPWKTIGHLSFAVSSFVQHFIAIGEFKLELLSGNAQFGSNSMIFRAVWPWNLTYDLEKQ